MAERMIKHKVFFIWDWEAEEIWINRMANQGWNLIKVGFCRYEFEKGEPNQWQYRLQALGQHASAEESQKYMAFMESMDIEIIGTFLYWVYFRQRTENGPFEIFSDTVSKVRHMKRIMTVIYALLPALILNVVNLSNLLLRAGSFADADFTYAVCGMGLGLILALLGLLLHGLRRMHKKVRKLKSQDPFSAS